MAERHRAAGTPAVAAGGLSNLNSALRQALSISRRNGRRQVMLECFTGTGRLSSAIERSGWGCVRVELFGANPIDMCHATPLERILGWISSRLVAGVWLGTPCSSWSAARHDIDGAGPRSSEHIYGKPGLSQWRKQTAA